MQSVSDYFRKWGFPLLLMLIFYRTALLLILIIIVPVDPVLSILLIY